jgi:hypothetical protein
MLLKSDQWLKESRHVTDGVRGAISFRRIPETQIYALGQPTLDAIDEVVARVKQDNPSAERILWVTLREEPIVYINGTPYCLRRERFTLRNMKGVCSSTKNTIIVNDKAIQTTAEYLHLVLRLWRNDSKMMSSPNCSPLEEGKPFTFASI